MSDTGRRLSAAVHHNGCFTVRGVLERLFTFVFDGMIYNQVWEDPRIDLEALRVTPLSRILTIASGGCNVLTYLTANPEHIDAVDLNHNHMSLTRLKIAALEHLPAHEDVFRMFGCADSVENVESYDLYIRDHLDDSTRRYWDSRPRLRPWLGRRINVFTKNLYRQGGMGIFIRFLHLLARARRLDPAKILSSENREQQYGAFQEYSSILDGWVMRTLGRTPLFVFALGIPPSQYDGFIRDCGGDVLGSYRERVQRLACDFPISDNYFAWQAFGCRYDRYNRRAVPEYLKGEHYESVKSRIRKVSTHMTSLMDFLRLQPLGSMDRFVLLDSQDWMRPEQIVELWREIARVGRPGSRIVFRSMGTRSCVEEALPERLRARFNYEEAYSRDLHKRDRSAIYGGFHVYELTS